MTWTTKIYGDNNGDRLNFLSDAELKFYNETTTGAQMMTLGRAAKSVTIINSAGVLSDQGDGSYPTILPSGYGVILLSLAGAASNASVRMYSALAGQRVRIELSPEAVGSTASIWIWFSGNTSGLSGVICYGSTKVALSSIILNQSAASYGWVELVGKKDGTWAVENAGTSATEQASA